MTNTSNIKSRSYPDQAKLELITSLQFDEPHSSFALNRNIHGLVPHGIYQGFDVSLAGGMDLLIGGANFGAAVAKHADVSLTIHQQGTKTVTLAAGEKQYVVIDSFFQYGVRTKQVDALASKHAAEYKVVKTPELLPHHVVIACVDVPTGSTQLEDSMIMRSERSVGGWGIAEHINQYDPHPQYLQKSHAAVEAEIDAKSPSLLKYINLSMLWRALAKFLGDAKTYTDKEVKSSYTKVIGEAKAFTIKKHDEQQVHFEDEHNTAISYSDTKLTEAKAFATQKHDEQQAYVNTEVGKVHTFAQSLHDTQQNYINQQIAAVIGANVPADLDSIRELIAEIQSNETAINVMRNIQAKKLDKTATAANTLLFGGKTYDQAKSEFRSGLITSQRAVSDSVTSNSSVIAASLKGLNTVYKKAVSAYDLAASKITKAQGDGWWLGKTAKAESAKTADKFGGKTYDQAKSEFRSGLITSQRQVSDSVTSPSSVIAASLKGVKTAYDKAVSAYNLAKAAHDLVKARTGYESWVAPGGGFIVRRYGRVCTLSSLGRPGTNYPKVDDGTTIFSGIPSSMRPSHSVGCPIVLDDDGNNGYSSINVTGFGLVHTSGRFSVYCVSNRNQFYVEGVSVTWII
uniref:Phage tail fiber protein n=2 Tax=Vibrio TaxID=662 RepID=A0A0H3ZU58_9VIBR|nr:Phage tail fiber protein [Vibrio cyclitrophicus]AKN38225.1 hypothetical protein [Vibrio splendidus]